MPRLRFYYPTNITIQQTKLGPMSIIPTRVPFQNCNLNLCIILCNNRDCEEKNMLNTFFVTVTLQIEK
jgi:hypothetical protein